METIERVPLRYGLATAGVIIAYFLIVHFAGLGLIFELRIVDLVILAVGVYFSTVRYAREVGPHVTYFRIFLTGILTGFVASFAFAVFLFFYLMFADTALMALYVETETQGAALSPYTISILAMVLGTATGLLSAFISVNFVKTESF